METLEQFHITSGLAEEAEECQVSTLLYNAEDVLHSTNICEEDRKKYGEVLENFNQFFRCRRTLSLTEFDLILDTSKKVKPLNSISMHCTV